jgi:hypothetical protein
MPKKKVWKAKLTDGFQPVMIDLEVHKAIEAARRNFNETQNVILRRLLGLDSEERTSPSGAMRNDLSSLQNGGLALPDGAELRADFCGVWVRGAVHDGNWKVEGTAFSLPAAQLMASLSNSAEPPPELDGWSDWQVRLPGGEGWQPVRKVA